MQTGVTLEQPTDADVHQQRAQETGFTLNEIQLMLEDSATSEQTAHQWRRMARAKVTEIEQIINHYRAMKELLAEELDCACLDLAECALLDV